MKYRNGNETEFKVEPNYRVSFPNKEIMNQVSRYAFLEQKLINVFKRLDIEKQKEDGERYIDWVDAEVTATVIHDGFKITGTKQHDRIYDIKILKERRTEKIEWEHVVGDNPFF